MGNALPDATSFVRSIFPREFTPKFPFASNAFILNPILFLFCKILDSVVALNWTVFKWLLFNAGSGLPVVNLAFPLVLVVPVCLCDGVVRLAGTGVCLAGAGVRLAGTGVCLAGA